MIVALDDLKRALGIDLDDTDEDANLTRIIEAKTVWVEGETKRRFDTPVPHEQYEDGTGEEAIYLEWHVDDSPEADNPSESLDPTTSVRVFRRPRAEKWRPWEELVEGQDWERRGQTLLFLRTWQVWPGEDEFKITYMGGYAVAPKDVQELVIELAMNQYMADADTSSGTAGITSEKIGDYSYSVGGAGGASSANGFLTDTSSRTLNRYKRMIA